MPPPTAPRTLAKPRLLIGEGKDEELFLGAIVASLGIADVQVELYGGKNNLSRYLNDFLLRPGRGNVVALGITRDADADANQAFQSVTGLLGARNLPVPGMPGLTAGGTPRVGVYILPDNTRPGMLEDLCLDAVQQDAAISCLEDYFQCIAARANRSPGNMAKARIHAWLASQIVPDRRLGEAAQAGVLPWNAPAFSPLLDFVKNF